MDTEQTQWGVVELFGHKVIAGMVSKTEMLGVPMLRVDVPATKRYPAFTQMFGQGAVYSVTFVSEDVARLTAEQCAVNPVAVYVPDLVTRQAHETEVDDLQQQIARLSRGLPSPGDSEEGEEEEDDERRRDAYAR